MPIKQWKKLRDRENKEKKSIKNLLTKKRFYAGVAVILIAILLLGIGLRARENALRFEKETTANLNEMLEQLSDMEAMLAESKGAINNVTSKTSNTKKKTTTTVGNISKSTEEINTNINESAEKINVHLDEVQENISDTKKEITDLLEKIDKSKTKEIEETYSKIKADFDTLTGDFNTSMDDVKDLLFKLSEQSKTQYEDTIKKIDDLQLEMTTNQTKMVNDIQSNDNKNTNTILDRFTAFSTSLRQEFTSRIDASEKTRDDRDNDLQAQIDAINAKVNSVDTYYPIGSLYLSLSGENPGDIWGGSWELMAQGQTLLGASDAYPSGSSGGSATVCLTQENIPNYDLVVTDPGHTHDSSGYLNWADYYYDGRRHTAQVFDDTDPYVGLHVYYPVGGGSGGINASTTDITVNSGGGGQEFSVMQPYLAVNIWKRVA